MADSNRPRAKLLQREKEHAEMLRTTQPMKIVKTKAVLPDFDLDDPRSLISLVPDYIQEKALTLPQELLAQDEDTLETLGFPEGTKAVFRRMRFAFWDEYDTAQRYELPIDMRKVFKKTGNQHFFEANIAENPARLAWFLTPPTEYQTSLRDAHELSLRALRAAAAVNPVGDDGKVNIKLVEAQVKIFQHLDMRLKGAIIQRIDQRNMNMNVNVDANASPEVVDAANRVSKMTMEEIESKISELQSKSKRLAVPGVVEVDLLKDIRPAKLVDNETTTAGQDGDKLPE